MSDFTSKVMAFSKPNHSGQGLRKATTNTGTRQMRTRVTMLAGVQVLAWRC